MEALKDNALRPIRPPQSARSDDSDLCIESVDEVGDHERYRKAAEGGRPRSVTIAVPSNAMSEVRSDWRRQSPPARLVGQGEGLGFLRRYGAVWTASFVANAGNRANSRGFPDRFAQGAEFCNGWFAFLDPRGRPDMF